MGKQKLPRTASAEHFPESLKSYLQVQREAKTGSHWNYHQRMDTETQYMFSALASEEDKGSSISASGSPCEFLLQQGSTEKEPVPMQQLGTQELLSSETWGGNNTRQLHLMLLLFWGTSKGSATWPFPSSIFSLQMGEAETQFPILLPLFSLLKSLSGKASQWKDTFLG